MRFIGQSFKDLLADESGATAIEYGLIAGLIVVAIVAGATSLADSNNANYDRIETNIVV